MADAGIGEAAVAESAKGAGEAAAAAGAADAGTAALAAEAIPAVAEGSSALGTIGSVAVPELSSAASLPLLEGSSALGTVGAASALPSLSSSADLPALYGGAPLSMVGGAQALPSLSGGPGSLPTLGPASATAAGASGGSVPAAAPGGVAPTDAGVPAASTGQQAGAAAQQTGLATGDPTKAALLGPQGYGAAASPAELAAAPGASGPTNLVDKAMAAIGNNPLQAANVGLGATSLAMQASGAGSAQKQLSAAAKNAQDASNQLLQQFKSGQLTGADAYAITQWTQQQKASVEQYYQKAGLSNSSMHMDAIRQIDAQAESMRQQAVQNLLKNGLQAAGVANPLIQQGVTAGMNQDAAAMKSMQDFIGQLSKMNTPAPTGTPG